MVTKVLKVDGIMCGNCVKAVSEAVGALAGVSELSVSEDFSKLRVVYDEAGLSAEQIARAIEGVPAKSFRVTGEAGEAL
jgi:copper chaperone